VGVRGQPWRAAVSRQPRLPHAGPDNDAVQAGDMGVATVVVTDSDVVVPARMQHQGYPCSIVARKVEFARR
jgi:hypothetical protein